MKIPKFHLLLTLFALAFIAGFGVFEYDKAQEENTRLSAELTGLEQKHAQLEARMHSLMTDAQALHDQSLKVAQLSDRLDELGIPYARRWGATAAVETGWGLQAGTGQYNNPFGFRHNPESPAQASATDNGYATYEGLDFAIEDLAEWIIANPPAPYESFTEYLKRRHYNTETPTYYSYLDGVIADSRPIAVALRR